MTILTKRRSDDRLPVMFGLSSEDLDWSLKFLLRRSPASPLSTIWLSEDSPGGHSSKYARPTSQTHGKYATNSWCGFNSEMGVHPMPLFFCGGLTICRYCIFIDLVTEERREAGSYGHSKFLCLNSFPQSPIGYFPFIHFLHGLITTIN